MFTSGAQYPNLARGAHALLLVLFTSSLPALGAVPNSEDACKRLSEGAKITNTKALIIGYEGLFSSSPINANLLSSYREKLATGQKASRPLYLFGGSFLTRGPLTRVVEQYKNRVQVLMFGRIGQTGPESVPGKCAAMWMQDKGPGTEGRKVIIVGHSFGGAAARDLANSLQKKNVKVDAVITADPRDPVCMGECFPGSKPANVSYWGNFYQNSFLSLRGHKVSGASNTHLSGVRHGTIQNAPAFYQAIANRIDGVSGPLTVAAPKHAGEGRSGSGGTLNPSSISGIKGSAAPSANPIPTGGQAARGAATSVGSNPMLKSLSAASPSRSRAEEERWFNRVTPSDTASGASGTAKAVPLGDGVIRYYKPGGGPPERGRGLSMAGASMPGGLKAASPSEGSAAGSAEGLSIATTRAGSSSTGMLNQLWPLSKVDSAPMPGGGNYGLGGSPASTSATPDLFGPDSSSAFGPGGTLPLVEGGNTEITAQAQLEQTGAELTLSGTSLFRRVHLKHVHWIRRKDRF